MSFIGRTHTPQQRPHSDFGEKQREPALLQNISEPTLDTYGAQSSNRPSLELRQQASIRRQQAHEELESNRLQGGANPLSDDNTIRLILLGITGSGM
jgi:hypothetical protein